MDSKTVEHVIKKMDGYASAFLKKGKLDSCLAAISASAEIQYQWNQTYTDAALERMIAEIAAGWDKSCLHNYQPEKSTVLFYDSFGLDTRGLALIYLKALCKLGYKVIYVVPGTAKGRQPEIKRNTDGKDIVFYYLGRDCGRAKVDEILHAFATYHPAQAFFYTTPNDGEACVSFACVVGVVRRYQINLTDHAFWLGVGAFDYCLEFRNYGASVSVKYRGIPESKLVMMPYYPFVDTSMPFAGFDFPVNGRRILFSGGSLYKTIDKAMTYYHMVGEILSRHDDVMFLYAGSGDESGLHSLQKRFGDRVVHIQERKDLYALLCHTDLYLNTYPMIGGLMSQYATMAGRPPLTLVRTVDCTLDGLVLNHDELPLEFTNEEDLLAMADTLLNDEAKLEELRAKVKQGVLTENGFQSALGRLLQGEPTGFTVTVDDIDTADFLAPYRDRFTREMMEIALVNRHTRVIWHKFPVVFMHRLIGKIRRKMNL